MANDITSDDVIAYLERMGRGIDAEIKDVGPTGDPCVIKRLRTMRREISAARAQVKIWGPVYVKND